MLWLVLGLMTLATTALLIAPLLRSGARAAPARAEHDLTVFRAQLRELEGDVERGLISGAAAAAARTEIERRILSTADAAPPTGAATSAKRVGAALAIAVAVPVLAMSLYLSFGSPGVEGQAFATRASGAPPGMEGAEFAGLVDRLARRLEKDSENVDGWRLLGRSYSTVGRYREAAAAFRRAADLNVEDAATQTALAENLMFAANGVIGSEIRRIFELANALDPEEPGARYYLAEAAFQARDYSHAYDGWLALARDASADAPWLLNLMERLDEVAGLLGIEVPPIQQAAPVPASPGPSTAPAGPSAQDVARAAEMTGDERQAFIESMVGRLAARLADQPGDIEGWLRLGQAYTVLGRSAEAREAYTNALERTDPASPEYTSLNERIEALGAEP